MSADNDRRTKPISFMVTLAQNEQIERAAQSEGLATASYVRRLVVTPGALAKRTDRLR